MAILNLTPDSFSDGGQYHTPELAKRRIQQLIEDGADIIDIGAESSRPGSQPISIEEEQSRLAPVLTSYTRHFSVPYSLDTTKPEIARFGLENGATWINDISGLDDPDMATTIAEFNSGLILMHRLGPSDRMQDNPIYGDVVDEIGQFFETRLKIAESAGITKIVLDPGIGFGKTVQHNLEILNQVDRFKKFGYPILIGLSRKSFLGQLTGQPTNDRLIETIAGQLAILDKGVDMIRVHDVAEMKWALTVYNAIQEAICIKSY